MKNKLKTFNKALLGGLALNAMAMGYVGAETAPAQNKQVQKQKQSKTTEEMRCDLIDKIDGIIESLGWNKNAEHLDIEEKHFAFELFKYVVRNSQYDTSIIEENKREGRKSMHDHEIKDAHRCLIEGRSISTSDAIALSLMFRRANLGSRHITISNTPTNPRKRNLSSNYHEAVIIGFEDGLYFCDPTTVREMVKRNESDYIPSHLFLFSARDFFSRMHPNAKIVHVHNPISLGEKRTTKQETTKE